MRKHIFLYICCDETVSIFPIFQGRQRCCINSCHEYISLKYGYIFVTIHIPCSECNIFSHHEQWTEKQIQWRNFQLILKYIIYLTMLMIMFL